MIEVVCLLIFISVVLYALFDKDLQQQLFYVVLFGFPVGISPIPPLQQSVKDWVNFTLERMCINAQKLKWLRIRWNDG